MGMLVFVKVGLGVLCLVDDVDYWDVCDGIDVVMVIGNGVFLLIDKVIVIVYILCQCLYFIYNLWGILYGKIFFGEVCVFCVYYI